MMKKIFPVIPALIGLGLSASEGFAESSAEPSAEPSMFNCVLDDETTFSFDQDGGRQQHDEALADGYSLTCVYERETGERPSLSTLYCEFYFDGRMTMGTMDINGVLYLRANPRQRDPVHELICRSEV